MTSASASKAHREAVTADAILRNYAENAKQAARDTCIDSSSTGNAIPVSYSQPSGYNVSATGLTCPAAGAVQIVHISATTPVNIIKTLDIEVRMR